MASPAGSVRGRFDLDTRPAIRGVRDYRREAERADVTTRRLGESIDSSFGSDQRAQVDQVARGVRDLARTTTQTRVVVSREWSRMRRDVTSDGARMIATIDAVRDRLHALGRERATASVDVDGVQRAVAQVELLHSRLQALGRERATGRVAIGGGFTGGGFGGGGAAAPRPGGFAFAGSGGSGIGFGPFRGRVLAGAAAAGLPIASSLIGAGTSLLGSAAGAGLGAGAVGVAGMGALVPGTLGFIAVARPGMEALKTSQRAQEDYTRAVRDYGAASREARQAAAEFDRTLANQPGLRRALREVQQFRTEWTSLTQPARAEFFGGVRDVTRIGRRVAPGLARNATIATRAVRGAATSQARFLAGRQMQNDGEFFVRSFARELPIAERSLENVERTLSNIARAATPFFHEANVWTNTWTGGWAHSTQDIVQTRREIGGLVDEARDWGHLTGSVYRTVRDILQASSPSGDSMVVDLTETFDRWDTWIRSHPEQTRDWFEDAATSTSRMAGALGSAVGWLNQMATVLQPILNTTSDLVRAMSRLGLIGTPGAIGALYGAYRGVRGGGGGGGAGGMLGGGMPLMLGGFGGGGGRGRGRGGMRTSASGVAVGGGMEMAGARTSYLAPRAADILATPTGMLGLAGAAGAARLYRSRNVGIFGSREFGARAGALATPEGFAARYGGVAGARYGGPTSTLTRSYGLSRAASPVAGALRGAGRAFAPIALGIGALDLIGGQGPMGTRLGTAVSDMTFGLAPRPQTPDEISDRAAQSVSDFTDQSVQGWRTRNAMANIDAEIARLQGANTNRVGTARRIVGGGDNSFFGIGLGGGKTTDQQFEENKKRIELLLKERDALRQTNSEMRRQRRSARDAASRRAGYAYGSTLGGAYGVYRRAGMDPTRAGAATVDQAIGKVRTIRGAGVEALGEASLGWARQMAKNNPALRREVDRLTASIEARFRRMGKNVAIVNGNILTGSRSEWRSIRDAMTAPAEQARQKVMEDFTAIQKQAVGSLTSMGFSAGDARKLVQAMEKGGAAGTAAQQITSMTQQGVKGPVRNEGLVFGSGRKAHGGTIGGRGLMDTVPVPGGLAAPGESWIANRHTMAKLSRATVSAYGLTAEQMIRGETRRHSAPPERTAARGGRMTSTRYAYGGVTPAMANLISRLDRMGFAHGSTTGGTHAAGSYHYQGAAVDYGDASNNMQRLWSVVYPQRRRFAELFGPSAMNPKPTLMHYGAGFSDPGLQSDHEDHIHMAFPGGGARAMLAGLGSGAGFRPVRLRGVGIRQGGVPGLLRARAGEIYARGLQRRLNDAVRASGGPGGGGGGYGFGASDWNTELARIARARGWNAADWRWLVQHESGGNPNARNPSSGAYGLGQFLGSTATAYARYGALSSNPVRQIDAMGKYIGDRYGNPTSAKAFWEANNWYGRGGRVKWAGGLERGGSFIADGPTAFVAGEGQGKRRRERVTVSRENANVTRRTEGGVHIEHLDVHVHIAGAIGDERDVRALAETIGPVVADKIREALVRGASGVVD